MVPFMPQKAQAIWAMLGQEGSVADRKWPGIPQAGHWRSLKGGTPLGAVEGLFQKITDEEIAAEIQALHDRSQKAQKTLS
jgi:methionyl-tRNA synthetase